jgi:hypothetical protein
MVEEKPSEPAGGVVVQVEREKTKRWLIVSIAFTVCFCVACWTFLKFSQIERPWWHYIVVPIVPTVVGWFPGPLIIRRFRRYMAHHHDRTVNLERSVDPNRTTSGLNKDGTFEHD